MAVVELKPVNAWPVRKRKGVGRYRDENGCGWSGWFVREYKAVKHMIALSNGHLKSRYRFPNISIPFQSPMHRWENLWHVGGWDTFDEDSSKVNTLERLFSDVAAGLKPMGFLCGPQGEIQKYIRCAQELGLPFVKSPHHYEGWAELGVCQRGRIGESFKTEDVIASYRLLGSTALCGSDFLGEDEDRLRQVAEHQLSDYLSGWDYANPITNFDCILIGLLLGFPIESTVAFMVDAK